MHNIEIKSSLKNMSEVESLIDDVCESFELDEDNYGNVLIAVTEAVNNAIMHGNRNDENKLVSINASLIDGKVVFVIQDEGLGFNFDNLPDPTAPENIEKPDGRGIFLMKNLSDQVVFDLNGSKVSVIFDAQNG
jgi:serine/threonine-protein kinase RsbW